MKTFSINVSKEPWRISLPCIEEAIRTNLPFGLVNGEHMPVERIRAMTDHTTSPHPDQYGRFSYHTRFPALKHVLGL